MLLTIDVGNTNIHFGVFEEDLMFDFRLQTDMRMTGDEFALSIKSLLEINDATFSDIDEVVISSVVPQVNNSLLIFSNKYLNLKPLFVTNEIALNIKLDTDDNSKVGADRIVNACSAYDKHQKAVLVIDLGTATTFCLVSGDGTYLGGAITIGLKTALDALYSKASKLPKIELEEPKAVVGRNTADAMKTGIVVGYGGLIDRIVEELKAQIDEDVLVIATGGLSQVMKGHAKTIEVIDSSLTLRGMKVVASLNKEVPRNI